MARQATDALSYYPEDTRESDSEQYIESEHGAVGYMILRKLRKHIYGSAAGYYVPWSAINQSIFCKNNNITTEVLKAIMNSCFMPEIDLFDKEMYEKKGILTSHGIQKRWRRIVSDASRKNNLIKDDYNLLPASEITQSKELAGSLQGGNGSVNGSQSGGKAVNQSPKSTQRKEKESKEKNTLSESGQQVATPSAGPDKSGKKSTEAKARMPRREIPTEAAPVIECFTAKVKLKWDAGKIQLEALKFFNHYQANGWKQGKGKPIVDWEAAVNRWILTVMENDTNARQHTPPAPKPAPVQTSDVPRGQSPPAVSDEDKRIGFVNTLYAEWLEGTVKEQGLPPDVYTMLAKRIGYTRAEMDKIFNDADQDERAAKQKGLALYFNKLKEAGASAVFELAN